MTDTIGAPSSALSECESKMTILSAVFAILALILLPLIAVIFVYIVWKKCRKGKGDSK